MTKGATRREEDLAQRGEEAAPAPELLTRFDKATHVATVRLMSSLSNVDRTGFMTILLAFERVRKHIHGDLFYRLNHWEHHDLF
jgi:hypothetical protein